MQKCTGKSLGVMLTLVSALVISACAPKAQEDCGFVQNVYGERISWKSTMPITMYLHQDVPQSMEAPILAAAKTWNDTMGRIVFNIVTYPRITGPANPHKDGYNVIYSLNSWESSRNSEQGRTSVYWIGDLIKEADIRLNAYDFNFYWQTGTLSQASSSFYSSGANVNLEALVLHELGHVLGLKHRDGENSVMATYLGSGEDRTRLSSNDIASLRCEY